MECDVEVFDKARYHIEGEYPVGLPTAQAYVHTGMYYGWIVDNQLASEETELEEQETLRAYRERRVTGPQCYKLLGGVFASDMLSEEGLAFTRHYFDFERGQYMTDFYNLLAAALPSCYHVSDTWENYSQIAAQISRRYLEWKAAGGGLIRSE